MFNIKSITLILLIICSLCSSILGADNVKSGIPERMVALDPAHKLNLITKGVLNTVIVVPPNSTKAVLFAAEELQVFLQESFGVKVPVIETVQTGKVSIVLGDPSGKLVADLPRDGFIIRSENNVITIAGKDSPQADSKEALNENIWGMLHERGTVFGVYDFLERFIGARFYFSGEMGTVIPPHKDLQIPGMNILDRPDYTVRYCSYYQGDVPDPSVSYNIQYYRLRLETEYIPFGHGLGKMNYDKRFAATHPEYFALLPTGQRLTEHLCFGSGIKEEIYKDAEAFLSGRPASERNLSCWDYNACLGNYFCIMPEDSHYPCTCPMCAPHYTADAQASSDYIWNIFIDTANRLKENKIPGYLSTMAYANYNLPPTRKVPDNVKVMIAAQGPWAKYNSIQMNNDNKNIQNWVAKLGQKVCLWAYITKYAGLDIKGIPSSTPRAVGEYFKAQKNNIYGAFTESTQDRYLFNYLNHYVMSKIFWNTSTDVDALLKEQYQVLYGAGAPFVQKAFDRMEELWLTRIANQMVDGPAGPIASPPTEQELWNNIYSKDEIAFLTKMFDDAEAAAKNAPMNLKRIQFIRKEFLGNIIAARQKYESVHNDLKQLCFNAAILPNGKSINIDGKLDEELWKNASPVCLVPYGANTKALVTTNVRGFFDANTLYIAFECQEPLLAKIPRKVRPQDDQDVWRDNTVEIFIDPSGKLNGFYQLLMNLDGSLSDLRASLKGTSQENDWKWNSGAKCATFRGSNSWTAEIAIPLKNLPKFIAGSARVNFIRHRVVEGLQANAADIYSWSPYLQRGLGNLDSFGYFYLGDAPVDIMTNGDFESPEKKVAQFITPGWGYDDKAPGHSAVVDITSASHGKASLGLSLTSKSADSEWVVIQQDLPKMKPNTKYRLTYFLRTQDVKKLKSYGGANILMYDGSEQRSFPATAVAGTSPWHKEAFEFATNGQVKPRSMRLVLAYAHGKAWFDDIRLVELK